MTRATVPPILLQLQNPDSISSQITSLRALKNEVIGHDQRKEVYVAAGIIPTLALVLGSRWPGNQSATESNRSVTQATRAYQNPEISEESEACLQAILIIGSLVQGGPTFLAPIFASDILPTLLSILSSPDCPQRFCLPILRLLNTIADRLPLQNQDQWPRDTRLADIVFAPETVGAIRRIVAQNYGPTGSQASIELAAALIGKLCTEEIHKTTLAECGVLDALAVKIASFVIAQGFVLPGAEDHLHEPGALGDFPPPAPASARLAPILRAITVIIEQSKWRAEHFLSSPGIVTVFPKQLPEFAPTDIKKNPWGTTYLSGSAVPRHSSTNPVDHLLPSVPMVHAKLTSSSANFPPLGNSGAQRRQSHSFSTPFSLAETSPPEEDENSIVPWLLCILRSEGGMVQLMAARLVTVLFRLGLAKKHRVPMLGYLLVPILIRMLEKDFEVPDEPGANDGLITPTQLLKEEAPAVLANLVMDDQELQKHAVDGNVLKRLSQLLKETYNPVSETLRPMWHSEGNLPARDPETMPPNCRLGPPGYSPTLCHIMRYRESILKALAALVPFKDEYRKVLCDNGVVPYIIDSLKPRPSDAPADAAAVPKNTAADGNPTPTLLAACGAARMLTRSVSALRTSMIDSGVAQPLFTLVKHPDLEVQIAATAALCNLALNFSPMKEAIISGEVIPMLCEHARSSSTKLQIESLWALKHVVFDTSNDIRMKIVEALGPAWIRQIISQDPISALTRRGMDEETEHAIGIAMGRANSAGEQVDILNPMEDTGESAEELKMGDSMPQSKMSLDMFLPDARRRRKLVMHGNLEQSTQSRQDDIAVQEQTFDMLRNMMCGTGAPEMIDFLLQEIGQNELLDALADNLRPRTIQLPHRRDNSNRELQIPQETLLAVSAVIIHIAAGLTRHRQLLLSHPDLLRSLALYFNHSNYKIRSNCAWVVINLIYLENQSDREACRERVTRLKALGIVDQVFSLENDPQLDVKERIKTAIHLLNDL
ncbi:uncharacterized protein N7484_005663 [Penicillium longicatenatum]|uniref:uncharacterized protein n=1 Tax=Penicillium longicatenatum TaxID=1561947 RepID=UPI002546C988|nr:uncharacterized protein N7484_005663 [Penicillium longicatenatum]KAJ5643156.1 hypothetical protein N7484_005663 [Penicillium longicatenatum]